MDTAQWPQGIGIVKAPVENQNSTTPPPPPPNSAAKPRPQKEHAVNCPRCNSTNTKFCYYNNYSLSQPRYFCKSCRRYWTEGGSLRNVPVGGGSRKNRKSNNNSSSTPQIISANKKMNLPDLNPPPIFSSDHQNPKIHQGQDLNLAYNPSLHQFNNNGFVHNPQNPNSQIPIMEFLKTGNFNMGSRGFTSFLSNIPVSDTNSMYSSGFAVNDHQFKPSLSFSLDGLDHNNNSGYIGNLQDDPSRIPNFPFEELKPTNDQFDDHHQQQEEDNRGGHNGESNGYWNGLLTGGGGSW